MTAKLIKRKAELEELINEWKNKDCTDTNNLIDLNKWCVEWKDIREKLKEN